MNSIIDDFLVGMEIDFKGLEDFNIDLRPAFKAAWNMVNNWQSAKIGRKKLAEILTYKGFPFLHMHKTQCYDTLVKMLKQLHILESIIEKENPDIVYLFYTYQGYYVETDMDFVVPLLRQFANKFGFTFSIVSNRLNILRQLYQRILNFGISSLSTIRFFHRRFFNGLPERSNKENILFFHHGTTNMKVTDRLYRELQNQDCNSIYICSDGVLKNNGYAHATKEGFFYTYQEPFVDNNICAVSRRFEKRNCSVWKRLFNAKSFRQLFFYRNFDLFPVFQPVLESLFIKKFYDEIRIALATDKLVQDLRPKVGFLANDAIFSGHMAVYALRKNSIMSITIAPGPFADKYVNSEVNADYIFVWSDLEKENMIGYGIPREKIRIIGTDTYANLLARFGHANKRSLRDKFQIPNNMKVILFACRFTVGKDFKKISKLIDLLRTDRQLNNTFLIVKMHPGDISISVKQLERLFDTDNVLFVKDAPFYSLLRVSNLVISSDKCCTSMDSIMFSVPFIIWSISDRIDEDSPCKIPFDESIDIFVRLEGYGALTSDVLNPMLFDKQVIKKFKRLSRRYYQKHYSSLDVEVVQDFLDKRK
ncbi:hypothetical protein ACFL0V_00925 [Nanoarchaeota archaeon]